MSRNKLYTITVKILTLNDYVARVQTNAKLYLRSSFGHKELKKVFLDQTWRGILPTFNPLNKIVEPIVVCAMMTDT